MKKSLYGLKQAPHAWNMKLNKKLISCGMYRSQIDPCLYYRTENEKQLYISVYVDDLLVVGDTQLVNEFSAAISKSFVTVDLGQPEWLLNVKIDLNKKDKKLSLSQSAYIDTILKKFGFESEGNFKTKSIPIDDNATTTIFYPGPSSSGDEKDISVDSTRYREALGSLLYLALWTRPDISYAVHRLAKYSENPYHRHMDGITQILRYLKTTQHLKLNFNCSNELFVSVFVDSAYADDITTRRSSYGYVLLGCDGALGWASRMHKAVCTSTCEAEYRSLSECMKEMLYIQNTMQETYMTDQSVCDVFIDNKGAKSLAESPKRGKYTSTWKCMHTSVVK